MIIPNLILLFEINIRYIRWSIKYNDFRDIIKTNKNINVIKPPLYIIKPQIEILTKNEFNIYT